MKKELRTLVIDRTKWGRSGEGGSLLNKDGKMCCLGFECLAQGFKPKEIRGIGMPADVKVSKKRLEKVEWLIRNLEETDFDYISDSEDALHLAATNDDYGSTDKEKEKNIKKVFKKHGIKVEFIN